MQAKDYTIREFKAGTFQDQNGNLWCDMVLEENPSEPVRIVVKDPTKFSNGMKIYGKIKAMTSQQGKQYYRFFREKHPDSAPTSGKYDSAGQKHGNCLKIAADFYLAKGVASMTEDDFVRAIQELSSKLFTIQIPDTVVTETNSVQGSTMPIREVGRSTPEMQSLAKTFTPDAVVPVPEEEINLDDIPF